jgi:lipopolysaccharide/colanic/teichoic acid biosynthesis glycosyltransferase
MFDRICAAIGLVLLSPLFAIIVFAIKVDDRGPIFFLQRRMGKNLKPFHIFKFRSMVIGSEHRGPLTIANDERITRVGRYLRKSKLDELPQLFNVLRGEMRLVGARPELERYVVMFPSEYKTLLQDSPGLTDPASLKFRHEERLLGAEVAEDQYVNQILPAKLQLSLAYQRHRSIFSDLGVLLQTVARLAA